MVTSVLYTSHLMSLYITNSYCVKTLYSMYTVGAKHFVLLSNKWMLFVWWHETFNMLQRHYRNFQHPPKMLSKFVEYQQWHKGVCLFVKCPMIKCTTINMWRFVDQLYACIHCMSLYSTVAAVCLFPLVVISNWLAQFMAAKLLHI